MRLFELLLIGFAVGVIFEIGHRGCRHEPKVTIASPLSGDAPEVMKFLAWLGTQGRKPLMWSCLPGGGHIVCTVVHEHHACESKTCEPDVVCDASCAADGTACKWILGCK
jgi:hypothetical protein